MRLEELRLKEPDWPALLTLFKDFEFGSLMKLVPSGLSSATSCETVLSPGQLGEMLSEVKDTLSFDTEATGRNPVTAKLVGIALCREKGHAYYVPVSHTYPGAPGRWINKR